MSIRFILFIVGLIGKKNLPTKVAFKPNAALSEIAYFLFISILLGMLKFSGFIICHLSVVLRSGYYGRKIGEGLQSRWRFLLFCQF
jgi:hypothetical protein